MQLQTDPLALQAEALDRRARGQRVGFVPTMGFLHTGHTSLMDLARPRCDWLVVSIYVNPLQFGPTEDLARYPRDAEGDATQCRAHGVDCLFMPPELYAPDHATTVSVAGLTQGLCGASRPTHFAGVTTVVARLFGLVQPHLAVFGEKDFQQLAVIRRMTADLCFPVAIVGAPTVREADGLAMSSRNQYLTEEERRLAPQIHAALSAAALELSQGMTDFAHLEREGAARLAASGFRVDYFAVRRRVDLTAPTAEDRELVVLVAARLGKARLIDNLQVERAEG